MPYRVDVSSQAAADLRNLFRYISDVLRAPENAYAQLARLGKQIGSLAELPMRLRISEKLCGIPTSPNYAGGSFRGVLHGRHRAGNRYHPSCHLWQTRY